MSQGYGEDFGDGYAVTVAKQDGAWLVREFEDSFHTLATAVGAVRDLRCEGAAFALLNVEEEYFVVVRPGPSVTRFLISDATMAVDDDFAAEVLEELGVEVPDIAPETLDDVDGYAEGDLAIFEDFGLSGEVMSVLLDSDDDPHLLIERIAQELGCADELADAID